MSVNRDYTYFQFVSTFFDQTQLYLSMLLKYIKVNKHRNVQAWKKSMLKYVSPY